MLSLLYVDVTLPQYKPLKYAIIHICRFAHNASFIKFSLIPYLSTSSFHTFSNSVGPSGKLIKDSSSTFSPLWAKYNLSSSCLQVRVTWNLQYRWCVFSNNLGIAIFNAGSSSALIQCIQHLHFHTYETCKSCAQF
jgi:hypothetical protein